MARRTRGRTVKVNEVSEAVLELMEDYGTEVVKIVQEETENVAKESVSKLKASSPHKSGKYSRGWRQKTEKGALSAHATVYNTVYQLAHLLEKGHPIVNKHRVVIGYSEPRVHIKPVEDEEVSEYEKRLIKRIEDLQ